MKLAQSILLAAFSFLMSVLFPVLALAVPGWTSLKCSSLKNERVPVRLEVFTANIDGTESGFPSSLRIKIGDKTFKAINDNGTIEGVSHVIHPVEGVMVTTLDVKSGKNRARMEIWGVARTIHLSPHGGTGPDEFNGAVKFRAKLEGRFTFNNGEDSAGADTPSLLSCELVYDGGSAG